MTGPKAGVADVLLQDLWVHIGALVAVGFGAADLWYFHQLGRDAAFLFIVGGIAAFGVKIINGSSTLIRATANQLAATAVQSAAQQGSSAPPTPPAPGA